jgi:lipopolysaccharide transport system ATP-binding protein
MVETAVTFAGVWKKFQRGERHDSLRDLIPAMARRAFGHRPPADQLEGQEFWAVKNVSFEVPRGKALGIIGPNGSGKSTTLKLLTRILRPNVGHCEVRGRVGALIEVAAGFHPDLTGRENIFLQGSIMGMKRAEILSRLDQIIEFAGVTEFIDTPVKRYSSGMNARLGFAVAAHLNPDVLIIDEVLAVGDAAFQQRCFDRIRRLKREGVTLVFVSHNLPAVESLCDDTLLLTRGEAAFFGAPHDATALYLAPTAHAGAVRQTSTFERHGNGAVEIEAVRFVVNGIVTGTVASGTPLDVEIDVHCVSAREEVVVGFQLLGPDRGLIAGENGSVKLRPFGMQPGDRATIRVRIASLAVAEGIYALSVAAHSPVTNEMYDWHEAAYEVAVETQYDATRIGPIGLSTSWTLERRSLSEPALASPAGAGQ